MCQTALYSKCYLNITNPAFYKGCPNEPDSDYYMFSIRGYDPCPEYKIEFTDKAGFDMNFQLICQTIDESGFVDVSTENVGYAYRDVVVPPAYAPFAYIATN